MGLKATIEDAALHALKNQEAGMLSVLRMLRAAIQNREIEKRGKGGVAVLTEEETAAVLRSEVKKRYDAIAEFQKAARADLVLKERAELAILERYLPPELSDDEVEKIVRAAAEELGAAGPKDTGRVIGEAMKRVKGQASGDRVSSAVRRILAA